MKKLSAIILTLAILLTALSFTACGTSLDLKDYTTVEFSGVDGNATAKISFNFAAFEEAYSAANGSSDPFSQEALQNSMRLASFENTLEYEVSPAEGLSNGDEVEITFTYSKDAAKSAGVSLKNTSYKLKVEDLTEAIIVDAFDPAHFGVDSDIYIEYEGTAPYGSLNIYNKMPDSDPLSEVTYSVDNHYGENKYGENLTITASLPYDAEEEGYVLKEETYDYMLDNVDHYMVDAAELNAGKEQLKADTEDALTAGGTNTFELIEGDWLASTDIMLAFFNGGVSTTDCKASNIYLLKEKGGNYADKIYVTATGTVHYDSKTYPVVGIYNVTDFIVKADGSLDYNHSSFYSGYYATEDDAYQKVLNPLVKEYNIETVPFND